MKANHYSASVAVSSPVFQIFDVTDVKLLCPNHVILVTRFSLQLYHLNRRRLSLFSSVFGVE